MKGRGIEMLVARHDLANEEALDYLERRLREIGVIAELQRAGFEPGDEVVVGEVEFELDPSWLTTAEPAHRACGTGTFAW